MSSINLSGFVENFIFNMYLCITYMQICLVSFHTLQFTLVTGMSFSCNESFEMGGVDGWRSQYGEHWCGGVVQQFNGL